MTKNNKKGFLLNLMADFFEIVFYIVMIMLIILIVFLYTQQPYDEILTDDKYLKEEMQKSISEIGLYLAENKDTPFINEYKNHMNKLKGYSNNGFKVFDSEFKVFNKSYSAFFINDDEFIKEEYKTLLISELIGYKNNKIKMLKSNKENINQYIDYESLIIKEEASLEKIKTINNISMFENIKIFHIRIAIQNLFIFLILFIPILPVFSFTINFKKKMNGTI